MKPRALIVVLLLSAAWAGCLTSGEEPAGDPDAWKWGDPLEALHTEDHNHSVAAHHNLSSPTMHLAGHADLTPELLGDNTYGELEVQGDHAYVATLDPGGFIVVDISDRFNPVEVGRYVAGPQSYGADVKVTPDGKYAFLAVSNYEITPTASPNTILRNVNNTKDHLIDEFQDNPIGQASFGVQVVDLSDPTMPAFASFYPTSPRGVHMVFYHEVGDMEVLATATVGFTPVNTAVGGERVRQDLVYEVDFLKFDRSTPKPSLVKVADYRLQGENGLPSTEKGAGGYEGLGPWNVHDVSMFDDPLATGRTYALASYWDWGAHILDITDLPQVELVGVWDDFEPRANGNIHTLMMDAVGERRIVTATEELFELSPDEEQVAYAYVIDATDLAAPKTLSKFSLPGRNHVDGIRFSTHNHQFVDGKLFVAWYHAGVWVLDVSDDEKLYAPEVMGYAMPNLAPERPEWQKWFGHFPQEDQNAPDVWDVVVRDGIVWALDRFTGLYSYHVVGVETGTGIDSMG